MFLLLRIILILLIVRALWLLVRGILEGVGYRMLDPSPPGVKLVRDPVCGVFVTPGRALTERSGGETAYFCSEKCRNQWRGKS